MKGPRTNKRQLEADRKARAERKRQSRLDRPAPESHPTNSAADQEATLVALADLHQRFAAGTIDFDEFESRKQELTEHLDVD